ncbi:MAG: AraC family transcriptional regulator [Firmicutes bacterium]|nr:AraC family transcriptional regulator [Bacillota bacterium]
MKKLGICVHEKCYSEDFFGKPPYMLAGGYEEISYYMDMHMHDFVEICIVLEGSCFHHIDSRREQAQRGSVFIVPPGVLHGFEAGEHNDAHVLNLIFHRSFFMQYSAHLNAMTAYPALFMAGGIGNRMSLCLKENALSELLPCCKALCDGNRSTHRKSGAMLNALGLLVISELCEIYSRDYMPCGLQTAAGSAAVLQCVQYMNEHLGDSLSLEALGAAVYISPSALCRSFESVVGMPPMQYLHQLRLQKARELLQSTALPLSEISQLCGFYDASHFCRRFKAQNGIPPREYRKRYGSV